MSNAASDTFSYYTSRGTIYYTPAALYTQNLSAASLPQPPCRPRQRRPHSIHITRLPVGFVPFDLHPYLLPKAPKKPSRFRLELRKLANRENAKRVLGSVFSPFTSNHSAATSSAASSTRSESPGPVGASPRTSLSLGTLDTNTIFARRAAAAGGGFPSTPPATMPPLADNSNMATPRNGISSGNTPRPSLSGGRPRSGSAAPSYKAANHAETEKPVCAANGVACYINLAEPVIFLTGLDHDGTTRDSGSNTSSLLRGKLILNVTKNVKIKAVTLKFTGRARTEWPEGKQVSPVAINID